MTAIVLDEVASTNDWLLARADSLPDGQWVRARRQSAGRGRQGRPWVSPEGNLAASGLVRLRPGDPPAEQIGFAAGVALYETCARHANAQLLQLKWPNDLLLHDAKLAGLLLERSGSVVVVGVGVNLAQAPVVPGRPTAALPPPAPDPDSFLAVLADSFAAELALWRAAGFAPLAERWQVRATPPGTALRLGDGRDVVFDHLAADGALVIRTTAGSETIRAGDVMLLSDLSGTRAG
ncbi:biotin--[acetyl-CoA-carboxylase] ligase [Thermaurantiacus sp.]